MGEAVDAINSASTTTKHVGQKRTHRQTNEDPGATRSVSRRLNKARSGSGAIEDLSADELTSQSVDVGESAGSTGNDQQNTRKFASKAPRLTVKTSQPPQEVASESNVPTSVIERGTVGETGQAPANTEAEDDAVSIDLFHFPWSMSELHGFCFCRNW